MAFMGNPCPCGWSLTDIDENTRKCEHCHRVQLRKEWGWDLAVTPETEILKPVFCDHKRLVSEPCPHCRRREDSDEAAAMKAAVLLTVQPNGVAVAECVKKKPSA